MYKTSTRYSLGTDRARNMRFSPKCSKSNPLCIVLRNYQCDEWIGLRVEKWGFKVYFKCVTSEL